MISTQAPAIDKAVRIFDFLSQHSGSTFSQIYQATNLPKSTASSLLASLLAHGLLRQEQNKYYLGIRLYEFGHKAYEDFDIKRLALESLTRLRDATKLTCHLGVLEGGAAIYLTKLESPGAVIVRSWVGKRLSLHSSGLGKALMAWLTDEEIDLLLPEEIFEIYTQTTIPNKTELKKELLKIRKQGWAFDNSEDSEGVYCIAVPIFDKEQKVIAAISISGVSFQISAERIPQLSQLAQGTAREIFEKQVK